MLNRNGFWTERKGYGQDGFFRCWRIPFIGKGAIGTNGCGHHRVLGITYSWLHAYPKGWAPERSLNLWGLLKITHSDTGDGRLKAVHPGWRVERCKPRFTIGRV